MIKLFTGEVLDVVCTVAVVPNGDDDQFSKIKVAANFTLEPIMGTKKSLPRCDASC